MKFINRIKKKKIYVPKDWGFFKKRIKYRKCLIEAYKVVGFSLPIGMKFFDDCLKKQDEIWNKRVDFIKKALWKTIPPLIVGLIVGLILLILGIFF